MIKRFGDYLVEQEKTIFFTFGRMNPPTSGHEKLLDKLAAAAGRNPYRVYLSQSVDKKKNPLDYTSKIKHARKMFPKHARYIMVNKNVKTFIHALVALYEEGYSNVVMVVGSDRVNEFDILSNKYNNQKGRHGFYNFNSIKVISAGERDPDAEGVEGMSASKMRDAASNNDFTAFSQGLPRSVNNSAARKIFNDVRNGMGLKEQSDFIRHVQLEKVSDTREAFVEGKLFELGDEVMIKETSEVGTLTVMGANYVIVEMHDGKRYRKWIDDVVLVDGLEESVEPHPEVVKAYKKTLDAEDKAGDYNHRANKARVTRAANHLGKKIKQHHPDLDMKGKIALRTHLQNMKEGCQPEWGTPESTAKAKAMTPGEKSNDINSTNRIKNVNRAKQAISRLKNGKK